MNSITAMRWKEDEGYLRNKQNRREVKRVGGREEGEGKLSSAGRVRQEIRKRKRGGIFDSETRRRQKRGRFWCRSIPVKEGVFQERASATTGYF